METLECLNAYSRYWDRNKWTLTWFNLIKSSRNPSQAILSSQLLKPQSNCQVIKVHVVHPVKTNQQLNDVYKGLQTLLSSSKQASPCLIPSICIPLSPRLQDQMKVLDLFLTHFVFYGITHVEIEHLFIYKAVLKSSQQILNRARYKLAKYVETRLCEGSISQYKLCFCVY